MKKNALIITLIVMLSGLRPCLADSVTYTISVTIPAIVGVNVPDPSDTTELNLIPTTSELETQYQHIVRNNTAYLLETIVAK